MALIKKFTTRAGVDGNYIAITKIANWDKLCCEADFYFSLYRDKKAAKEDALEPLVPIFAKLRLRGDAFMPTCKAGDDMIAAAYKVAKKGGLTCDAGGKALTDAADDL